MDDKNIKKVDRLINEFTSFSKANEHYSAYRSLGAAYEALLKLPKGDYNDLLERIIDQRPSEEELVSIFESIFYDEHHIHHILDTGNRYNTDEVLLVLTLRDGLFLIRQLLEQAFSVKVDLSLNDIDRKIIKKFSEMKLKGINSKLFLKIINSKT